ncbi:MAG: hypothetical protein WC294_07795 [Methanoregula sp.]|jgi:hypothetical protein
MFEGKHHFTGVYSISPGVTGEDQGNDREALGERKTNRRYGSGAGTGTASS